MPEVCSSRAAYAEVLAPYNILAIFVGGLYRSARQRAKPGPKPDPIALLESLIPRLSAMCIKATLMPPTTTSGLATTSSTPHALRGRRRGGDCQTHRCVFYTLGPPGTPQDVESSFQLASTKQSRFLSLKWRVVYADRHGR
eukprot:scaffold33392_cov55-Prasinocladus_malaysianus.AAC.3